MKFLVNSLIFSSYFKMSQQWSEQFSFTIRLIITYDWGKTLCMKSFFLRKLECPKYQEDFLGWLVGIVPSAGLLIPSHFFFLSFSLGEFSHMHVLICWLWRNMISVFSLYSSEYFIMWILAVSVSPDFLINLHNSQKLQGACILCWILQTHKARRLETVGSLLCFWTLRTTVISELRPSVLYIRLEGSLEKIHTHTLVLKIH